MINLSMPSRDSAEDDLRKALVTHMHKGVQKGYAASDEEITQILTLYNKYDADGAVASQIFKGGDLPLALNQALKSAFDLTQKKRKLYSIREALLDGVDLCPICGINSAKELDHHLPRSVFFPLAIYTRNLVPLCRDCNGIKLAGFGDDDTGDTHFLHAYFDVLPDMDFIRSSVKLIDSALIVEFFVDANAGLLEDLGNRLVQQMKKLELNKRYRAEINTYLASYAVSLHMHYEEGGAEGVAHYLRCQAKYETKAPFHRNHWRPVLLRALAALDPFVDGGFAKVLPMDKEMLDDLKRAT